MLPARGLAYASLAALLWGFVPVYIGYLGDVDPLEIVVHRALWSGVILLGLVTLAPSLFGGLRDARAAAVDGADESRVSGDLRSSQHQLDCLRLRRAGSADFRRRAWLFHLSARDGCAWNLGVARTAGQVGMGGRRPCRLRRCPEGAQPWRCALIALVLALSFALYGVTRKRMTVNPVIGMFVETVFLIPLSIIYLVWRHQAGETVFFGGGTANVMLAIFAGVVTVVPLLLYHAGNRALPISVASLLFYINPTTSCVVGLMYFDLAATPRNGLYSA